MTPLWDYLNARYPFIMSDWIEHWHTHTKGNKSFYTRPFKEQYENGWFIFLETKLPLEQCADIIKFRRSLNDPDSDHARMLAVIYGFEKLECSYREDKLIEIDYTYWLQH